MSETQSATQLIDPSLMVGSKVQHVLNERKGTVEWMSNDRQMSLVMYVGEKESKPVSSKYLRAVKTAAALQTMPCSDPLSEFIENWLKPNQDKVLLTLEAKDSTFDTSLRSKYKNITGEELTEGSGYHVAPDSAGKQGCQGTVSFPERYSNVADYPEEIQRILAGNGARKSTKSVDRIAFLWLLVEKGFRIIR